MNKIVFKTPSNCEEFKKYNLFRWEILRTPIGKSIESIKDEHEDSSYHLIGLSNNEIIACGRLHLNNANEAQIRYMAIDEHFQGKGIGKKIIKLLEAEAKKQNINRVVLNARDHVVEFYKKSGYKIIEKYEGSDTGIPHTTMEKII